MANWLGNPEHVYSDHPPNLSAGDLGGLVGAILKNKLGQQELTQKTLSEAIKAEQARRQQDAYAEVLRSTGLSEGQDLSGLNDADSTRIAQLLQQRTPNTEEDAYKAALTKQANAAAGYYDRRGNDDDGGDGQPPAMPEPQRNQHGDWMIPKVYKDGRIHWELGPEWMQDKDEDKPMTPSATNKYMGNLGVTLPDIEAHSKQHGKRNGQDVPYDKATDIEIETEGGVTRTIPKSTFEKIKRSLGVAGSTAPTASATPGVTPPASATPGVTPSPGASPTPTASPRPTTGTAKGYGRVLTSQEKQALAWARTHSGDPRAAQILAELGLN